MGQAKRRGTFEERKAQAVQREQLQKDMKTLTRADYKGAGVLLTLLAAAAGAQRGKAQ